MKQNIKPLDEKGLRHREWIEYHANGQLRYRWNYVHGIRHGFSEWYYDDGMLMYRGYMNMGRKIGNWYWYGKKQYYLWLI